MSRRDARTDCPLPGGPLCGLVHASRRRHIRGLSAVEALSESIRAARRPVQLPSSPLTETQWRGLIEKTTRATNAAAQDVRDKLAAAVAEVQGHRDDMNAHERASQQVREAIVAISDYARTARAYVDKYVAPFAPAAAEAAKKKLEALPFDLPSPVFRDGCRDSLVDRSKEFNRLVDSRSIADRGHQGRSFAGRPSRVATRGAPDDRRDCEGARCCEGCHRRRAGPSRSPRLPRAIRAAKRRVAR